MPDSNYTDMTGFQLPALPPVTAMSLYGQPSQNLAPDVYSGAMGQKPLYDTTTFGGGTGATAGENSGSGWFGGMFDHFNDHYNPDTGVKDGQGWGGTAIGGAQALFNAWMGMKSYGLAKQQLAEGKRQFQLNYDAQRSMTNAQLEDRQRARIAAAGGQPGAYQSVGDYMSQHAIPPAGG